MPTWKRKTSEETLFCHLCRACNDKLSAMLAEKGWQKIRDSEPASCNECTQRCTLSAKGLWGAEDSVRYAACAACTDYGSCPFKGRHYC